MMMMPPTLTGERRKFERLQRDGKFSRKNLLISLKHVGVFSSDVHPKC